MTGNTAMKPAKKKVSKFSKRKVNPAFYWMTIPAAILVAIFLYWPFLQGAAYSFTNSQGYGDFKFIGFKNYIAMFQDARVGNAYMFTIFIAVLITIGTNFIGMFLAVLLNSRIAFKNGFRAIFFIPYTLSVLVIGYVFKYIFMTPLPELSLKNSLGAFDQIMALTKGGPDSKTETVSYLIFQNGLGNGEYSYQMANAVTFFIVLAILAFVQLKFFSGKEKV